VTARVGIALAVGLVLGGCAQALHSERCEWSGRVKGSFVFQEQESISALFEVADVGAYRRVIPTAFSMPERPLYRVSVIDFYDMVNGPAYLESVIAILVSRDGELGWFTLTMPVTDGDSCWGGRQAWGYPKIVRRITLERSSRSFVGTSYAEDGKTRALVLTLEIDGAEPGDEVRELLRFVSPLPTFTLKDGKVLRFGGGGRTPIYDLERAQPTIWRVQLGTPRLEFPRAPDNLLAQLGVGRTLAGYWLRLRYRYSIAPRP
jgi:hypothetical protein